MQTVSTLTIRKFGALGMCIIHRDRLREFVCDFMLGLNQHRHFERREQAMIMRH
jgi:hypothetical protein